ncbi:MAG: RsmD family RNA methyltransferase [Pseudomonadota bacterium]
MRIIGGSKKGLALAPVGQGDAAAHLRPTSDRTREAIFNLIENGRYKIPLTNARVLDLFAGTGAMGLEAASRGACSLTLIDNGDVALNLIGQNIVLTQFQVQLYNADASQLPKNPAEPYDLVFMDPPYGKNLGHAALIGLQHGWVKKDTLVVWEEGSEFYPPEQYSLLEVRRYGDTFVHFLRVL